MKFFFQNGLKLVNLSKVLVWVTTAVVLMSLPCEATEIYSSIQNSKSKGLQIVYRNRWGRIEMQNITTYEYLMEDGSTKVQPYKIPHLEDNRPWSKKHPYLYMAGPVLLGAASNLMSSKTR